MQYVIFHGAFGNVSGNWFPWLKNELAKRHHKVILKQYPVDTWENIDKKGKDNKETIQNLPSWTTYFEKNVLPELNLKEPMIFVGHSLSPVFILHLVEKFNIKLEKGIFASPFLESLNQEKTWHFDVVNRTFYKTDFDWKKLQMLIPVSVVLYGTDDPYVPNKFPIDFAKRLRSKLIPVENGKHLGDNLKEFPLILNLCL